MARLIIASEIGAHLGRDGLVAAEREVVSRLASIGICGEDRAYRPHLTLARVRQAVGLRSARPAST